MEIINQIAEQYPIVGVYGLLSGGHDSLTACHIASQHPLFAGIIHIDTTTGLRETQQFVIETCQQHNWPLYIRRPYWKYESLLMRRGFPGPAAHWEAYQYLKDRTLRSLLKELKASSSHAKNPHAKLLLMSGIRKDESNRRAVIQTKEHHMEGQRIWLAPIIDYSATDCTFYIRDHNLKRSPVKDRIHMSGECFCGAFARPSEYHELKQWYPYQVERIHKWQALVEMSRELRKWEIERGLAPKNEAIKHCQWGWKDSLPQNQMSMPMCWSCSNGHSDKLSASRNQPGINQAAP